LNTLDKNVNPPIFRTLCTNYILSDDEEKAKNCGK